MTPQENKDAYDAFKLICSRNGDSDTLYKLEIMVGSMGAEHAHILAMHNSGLPEDVKEIMLAVCRHIETQKVTS